jgi:hypothetical protein
MRIRNPAVRVLGGLLVCAALGFAAGCNDNGPTNVEDTGGDVLGIWTGISFGGSILPIQEYVEVTNRGTCLRQLNTVTLSFDNSGQYTWAEEVILDCGDTSPETSTNTFTGTWRVDGINLYMQDSEAEAEQQYTFTVKNNELACGCCSAIRSSIFQKA